jgi:hypothetical protein
MKEETSLHRIYKARLMEAANKLSFALEVAKREGFSDHIHHGVQVSSAAADFDARIAQYTMVKTHDL